MTTLNEARPGRLTYVDVSIAERLDVPRRVVLLAALSMIAIVVAILGFIAWNGIQIFVGKGIAPSEVFSTTWNPSSESAPSFGILPFIAGTVAVTAAAVLISAPLSVALALFLADVAPPWAKAVVQPSLEVFVGIPSVVWGFLGVIALVPFLSQQLGWLGFTVGFSWFAGSLVLALMILPTITAVAYDTFRSVPGDLRAASLALGTTRWQMMRHVVVPASRAGLLTAIVLGMTRAAGEALAVQMVIGNRPVMPTALTQPLTTLTSQITLDMGNTVFGEAWNDALWTMGLVLVVISLAFVLLVRSMNRRASIP